MIWHTADVLPTLEKRLIATVNAGRPFTVTGYKDGNVFVITATGGGVDWKYVTGWAYLSEVLDLTAQDSWEFSGVSISTGQLVFGGFYRQPNGGPCIVCCDEKEVVLVPVAPETVKITPQYME